MGTQVPEKTAVTEAMTPESLSTSTEEEEEDVPGERSAGGVCLAELRGEQELKGTIMGIIEALLFVSREPLTLEKITAVLAGPSKETVHDAMKALQDRYNQEDRGIHIAGLAGGYLMMTQPDCAKWIVKLNTIKASAKVSRSALETLAIVAYRQPIMRTEIEQLRGVETSGVLRTLLDQRLIRIVGRKDIPGRPMLYGTSRIFLQRFGLQDLRDLPPLREFNELGQGESTGLFDEALASNGRNGATETDVSNDESGRDVPEPVVSQDSSVA